MSYIHARIDVHALGYAIKMLKIDAATFTLEGNAMRRAGDLVTARTFARSASTTKQAIRALEKSLASGVEVR